MLNDITDEARRRYLERSAQGWPLPPMGKRRVELVPPASRVVPMRKGKAA